MEKQRQPSPGFEEGFQPWLHQAELEAEFMRDEMLKFVNDQSASHEVVNAAGDEYRQKKAAVSFREEAIKTID